MPHYVLPIIQNESEQPRYSKYRFAYTEKERPLNGLKYLKQETCLLSSMSNYSDTFKTCYCNIEKFLFLNWRLLSSLRRCNYCFQNRFFIKLFTYYCFCGYTAKISFNWNHVEIAQMHQGKHQKKSNSHQLCHGTKKLRGGLPC